VSGLVSLREAGFPPLAALHAASFERPWSAEEIEAMASAPGCFGMAAVDGTDLLGFILMRVAAGEGEVLTLAVDPAARRRGVGRGLMTAAAETAKACGAEHIFLEVAEDNDAAQALYAASGYELAGRRPGYYARAKGKVDAILLRARLNSETALG
jgi:ribosomal-protein-alanine N-acetyltransferase